MVDWKHNQVGIQTINDGIYWIFRRIFRRIFVQMLTQQLLLRKGTNEKEDFFQILNFFGIFNELSLHSASAIFCLNKIYFFNFEQAI